MFVDGNGLAITLGCGGCLTADLTVTGREGHAAHGTGVSAIDKGFIIKQAIDEFKREREAACPDCRVNVGIFRSGAHAAVVPGSAYLSLNIVYTVAEAEAARAAGYPWGGAPGALRGGYSSRGGGRRVALRASDADHLGEGPGAFRPARR